MKRLHALALGAAALGANALPAMAQTAPPLRVGGSYDEDYAEGFYAQDMGFFRAGGFDANVMPMKNGGAVIPALAGGALDVGIVNLASVSAAFARGLPLTLIAPCALYSSAFTTQAILVAPDSPIRTAKDLSGKKMALTSLSSLLQVGVENWIDENGGSAADVQYLEVPLPEMVLAVKSGRVDAVGITEPWITQAKDQTRLLAAPFASIAKRFLITAWVANRQWVADNPASVKRFRAVIAQTASWVNSHPQETATILSKYLGVPVSTVAQMKRTQMATALDPTLIQPVIDAATRYKLVPQAFPAANMIAS